MSHVSLDTSALIEYINLSGSLHREARAVIPHPVFAETYYVSAIIYEKLNIKNLSEELKISSNGSTVLQTFSVAEASLAPPR